MSAMLLALALQAAPAAAGRPPPPPERFSILVDPCASSRSVTDDVVVCGRPETLAPRLPLPQFRGPRARAGPSNPEMRASVALDGPGIGAECGAYGENCPGIANGQALPALLGGAVDLVKDAFRKKPDKRGRVPIPLDDPAPPPSPRP